MATTDVCKNAKASTTVKYGTATIFCGLNNQTKERGTVPTPTTPEGYEAKLTNRFDNNGV